MPRKAQPIGAYFPEQDHKVVLAFSASAAGSNGAWHANHQGLPTKYTALWQSDVAANGDMDALYRRSFPDAVFTSTLASFVTDIRPDARMAELRRRREGVHHHSPKPRR